MTVCERLWTGRRLDNLMVSRPPLVTDEERAFIADAKRGSAMLRDALFRANGYIVPQPQKKVVQKAPVFKPVKIKAGRERGSQRGAYKVRTHNINVVRIIGVISEHLKVTTDDIVGRSRQHDICHARKVAMYLARNIEHLSFNDIAHQFSGRDHTTVMSAINDVKRLIAKNDQRTISAINFVRGRL